MKDFKTFFSKFTDFNFLLAKNPPFALDFILFFLIFFALIFLAGILIPLWLKKKHKKVPPYEKLASKIQLSLSVFSLLGFILLFFDWQAIPYFASPILILLLFLAFIFWLVYLLVYLNKDFKKELFEWKEQFRKLKYLPRSRK